MVADVILLKQQNRAYQAAVSIGTGIVVSVITTLILQRVIF